MVPDPGDPQSLNRYSYAGNNPLRNTDPSGHWYIAPRPDPEEIPNPGPEVLLTSAQSPTGDPMQVYWSEIETWDPITTADFASVMLSPLAAPAMGIIGEIILADAVIPGMQALWSQMLSWSGLACADGDCGNEVENLTQELPDEIASTFKNSQYQAKVLTKPLTVYRAEGSTFGRWFGTVKPDSAANAERLYNIVKYENDALQVSTYEILPGATIYEGPVAGGTGWQIFIENPLSGFIKLIETEFLPQWGF
jgi:hypothetical protein